MEDDARLLARIGQGPDESCWVDLMVAFDEDPAARSRCKEGLEGPALRPAQTLDGESETPLEVEDVIQRGVVVEITRDGQRSAAPVADVVTGDRLEFGNEPLEHPARLEIQLEQSFLAVLDLGHRRQHAGGNI
jgi:hypothetical protein